MLGKLLAYRFPNFIIVLSLKAVRRSKAPEVRDRFDVPHDDISHNSDNGCYLAQATAISKTVSGATILRVEL
jgi:hypothetical protein